MAYKTNKQEKDWIFLVEEIGEKNEIIASSPDSNST